MLMRQHVTVLWCVDPIRVRGAQYLLAANLSVM